MIFLPTHLSTRKWWDALASSVIIRLIYHLDKLRCYRPQKLQWQIIFCSATWVPNPTGLCISCVCTFVYAHAEMRQSEKDIVWLRATEHEDDRDTTLSLPCVFLASPSSSQCVCVYVFVCGHLAMLCHHFWGSAPALSSNLEYWQHEQSVSSRLQLASLMTAFMVSQRRGTDSQCKPWQH